MLVHVNHIENHHRKYSCGPNVYDVPFELHTERERETVNANIKI